MVGFEDDNTIYYDAETGLDLPPALPPHLTPINDPEEWSNYWSEELVTLYHSLIDHARDAGWALVDVCSFANFVEFAYAHSSRLPPPC